MFFLSNFLSFAFITPAFAAAGLALVGVPILIHILNRRRFKIVHWAAMEFLLRAMRKNRRRLQFEQWILLAVRCLLLLLVGLALARPGCDDNSLAGFAGQRSGLHVLVVDNSYSMSYEADRPGAKTHLDEAKKLAKTVIDRLSGGEAVILITSAKPATAVLSSPTYDLKVADAAVDRIEQSYAGSDLDGALQKSLDIGAAEIKQPNKTFYLFTDGTRSVWESPQADGIKQKFKQVSALYTMGVAHFNLGRPGQWNQAITGLHASGRIVTQRFGDDFLAEVRGFGSGPDRAMAWRVDDSAVGGDSSVHPEVQPVVVNNANIHPKLGGPHVISAALVGDSSNNGDKISIDDSRRMVVNLVSELKILIVEGERSAGALGGSGAYLKEALAPDTVAPDPAAPTTGPSSSAKPRASYVAPDLISDLELENKVFGDYRAIILCGVGQISEHEADQLSQYVTAGGTLLIFMGDAVAPDNYNQMLYSRHLLPGPLTRRMSVTSDQRGFNFDFQPKGVLHPILSDFKNVENSGLDTAQVFTYWQIELKPDSKVERVLDYTAGPSGQKDPALTIHSLGQGRVVFFSTTANADPNWTTFPAKPAYIALMHSMLLGSINSDDGWMNLTVGDALVVPSQIKLTTSPQLVDDKGNPLIMEQQSGHWQSRPLPLPGQYWLKAGDVRYPVVVNVPSDAADARTLDATTLKAAMGDIDVRLEGDQYTSESVSAGHEGKDLGWSLMTIVLMLAAVECFMAMRFGHHRRA